MTDPTPIRQEPQVPTFGRRTKPVEYRSFDLEYRMAANPEDVRTERFEVATDLDGGSLYAVMSAQTEAQQMVATARLMAQGLRDDDGVSATYLQPTIPMTWDEYDEATGQVHTIAAVDDDDDADTAVRRAELMACTVAQLRTIAAEVEVEVAAKPVKRKVVDDIIAAETARAEGPADDQDDEDEDEDDGFARDDNDLLYYLGPEGPTTDVTTLVVKHAEGSSRRRLAELMDHPRYIVEASALTEISRWLVREQAGRPTRKPRPSQTGPRRTGRGSKGR